MATAKKFDKRKIKRFVIAIWASFVLVAGNALSAEPKGCDFLSGAGPRISGGLGAPGVSRVNLEIPRDYIPADIPIGKSGLGSSGSIIVQMYIGTSRPYQRSWESRTARPYSSWFSALLSREANVRRSLNAYQDTYFRGQRQLSRPFQADGIDFESGISSANYDLIVPQDPSALRDVLFCSKVQQQKGVVNPVCRHHTSVDGLKVQISYSRRYLGDWEKIKAQLHHFIDCVTPRI